MKYVIWAVSTAMHPKSLSSSMLLFFFFVLFFFFFSETGARARALQDYPKKSHKIACTKSFYEISPFKAAIDLSNPLFTGKAASSMRLDSLPCVPLSLLLFSVVDLSGLIHKGDTTQSRQSVSSACCRCAAMSSFGRTAQDL